MRALTKEDLALVRGGGYGGYYYSLLSRYYGAVDEVAAATYYIGEDEEVITDHQTELGQDYANIANDYAQADPVALEIDLAAADLHEAEIAVAQTNLVANQEAQYAWLIVEQNLAAELAGYGG